MNVKPRILITGGTGYIGSNVMKFLIEKEFLVYNLTRNDFVNQMTDVVFNKIKPEIVLHFTTYFSNLDTYSDMLNFEDSNIAFGMDVAYFCDIYHVKTFVNFTTFQLHYNNFEYNPVNLYAATKKAFMDILEYYHRSGKFKVVNIELNSVYGPWDKRSKLIPNLLKLIKTQYTIEKLSLTNPNKIVDLVNILFVCNKILDIIYEVYNLSDMVISGEWISIIDLVKMIEKISKTKINVEFNSGENINREMMYPYKDKDYDRYYNVTVKDEIGLQYYLNQIIKKEQYYIDI